MPTPQNGQTLSNNLLVTADELSMSDHFVGLTLKGLRYRIHKDIGTRSIKLIEHFSAISE